MFRSATLTSLAEFINGYAFKPADLGPEGLPVIRIEQLKDRQAQFDYSRRAVPAANIIDTGDLLFSWSASLYLKIWDQGKALLNQHLFKVVPRPEIDKQFLKYCIEFNLPALAGSAHGSTMQHVTRKDLERFQVLVPIDKNEQEEIASKLLVIDRMIQRTEALIAKYERMRVGLLQDLLTRGLDEYGHVRPTPVEAPTLYQQTELGQLPCDWVVKKLSDLTLKIVDGVHHTPRYLESGVPFVTVKNLTATNEIDFHDINYVSEQDHLVFKRRADPRRGDLLVSKDGTLGVARIVRSDTEFSIFVSVAQLRPDPDECFVELLWLFFESEAFQRQLGMLSAGTGLRHIHLEHFRRFLVARPHLAEQERIASTIKAFQQAVEMEQAKLSKLHNCRSGLMKDLLTGDVPISANLQHQAAVAHL